MKYHIICGKCGKRLRDTEEATLHRCKGDEEPEIYRYLARDDAPDVIEVSLETLNELKAERISLPPKPLLPPSLLVEEPVLWRGSLARTIALAIVVFIVVTVSIALLLRAYLAS